jgi:hypothetical protein
MQGVYPWILMMTSWFLLLQLHFSIPVRLILVLFHLLQAKVSQIESVPWDVERFAEYIPVTVERHGKSSASKTRLKKFFHMPKIGDINTPAVIVDKHGRILIWYLPDILTGHVVSETVLFIQITED